MGLFGLFKPAWDSKDPEKRVNAVAALKTDTAKDLQKLQKAAKSTQYEDVRQLAYKRIILEATDWNYKDIRKEAVKYIDDEITLAQVSLRDRDVDVRREAVKKVLHPQLLEKIALSEVETIDEAQKHYLAVLKSKPPIPHGLEILSPDQFLSKIKSDLYPDVRAMAVARVTSQDVLEKVALHDSNVDVRIAAVKKITNQHFLKILVSNEPGSSLSNAALRCIGDQRILCEIIASGYGSAALDQLTKIFLESDSESIAPKTIELVVNKLSFNVYTTESITKKLLHIAQSNPGILKPCFPILREKCADWHNDVSHTDTQHTDGYDSGPVSNDCVHVDEKKHTDKNHSDIYKGEIYLGKFPPFFKD